MMMEESTETGLRSSSSQALQSQRLPRETLIHITDRLQQLFPPVLAESENLQNHVNLKCKPIEEYRKQECSKNQQMSSSIAELLYIDFVYRKNNRQPLCESDTDFLEMISPGHVHTATDQASAGLVLDMSECSPGYTRIKNISSGEYLLTKTSTVDQPSEEQDWDYVYNYQDDVPCSQCCSWDDNIASVFNTETSRAWPTKQQLEELKKIQILLVHRIDPIRKHENLRQYFRFSFSLQEKFLCRSLPHCYRYIYLCAKIIIKYFCVETELKSYYLKTTLFHFLAEHYNDQEKYSDLPGLGVLMLIEQLQMSFTEGRLSNFFVSEMNLIGEIGKSDRQKVIVILGEILSQPEIKITQLNNAVTVQDYRKLDQVLREADQARDMMAEALSHNGQERAVRMRQAIDLLENGRRTAPKVIMISWSLVHAYLLCEETEQATEIINFLDRRRVPLGRIEVVKLETRHSSLFSPATSDALRRVAHPVYVDHIDYGRYVESLYVQQTKFVVDFINIRLTPLLSLAETQYRILTSHSKFQSLSFALYVDMLEHLNSQYSNEAREKYEQFAVHLNDESHQSSD